MFWLWILTTIVIFEITNATPIQSVGNITHCGNLTCYYGASCRTSRTGAMMCMCKRGYQGDTCLNDLDECNGSDDPCYHRGTCSNTFGGFICACFKGWSSDSNEHCDIKDNSTKEGDRICKAGWIGEWCQDQCVNDSMCLPHQVCVEKHGGFVSQKGHICRCAPGWHGVDCKEDRDECMFTNTCPKDRSCLNTPGSHICTCLPGWTGNNCTDDINECLTNPCQHSTNCANTPGSYYCTCEKGWKGVNCTVDINECASIFCKNGGMCKNTPGSYDCNCNAGWNGTNCDVDIDECNTFSPPCLNNGTCVNTDGFYFCNCTSGWKGDNCEDDINDCYVSGNTDARKTYIIVGSVLGAFLLLCCIVAFVCIWKKKKRNGTRVSTLNGNEKFSSKNNQVPTSN